MRLRTTSTQRTYRSVRIAIVGVVVFLAAGVGAQIAQDGPLGSVSAAYYTPARNVFVGALCAVALALLALSGRSVEQALLDLAAVLAPVIALVPTPIVAGAVPGVDPGCPDAAACVPASVLPDVAVGMLALSVIGALAVVAAVVLGVLQRSLTPGGGVALVAAGVLVAAGTGWWAIWPSTFVAGAHYAATLGFFVLIAAVSTLAALRPSARTTRNRRLLRVLYAAIAAGIVGVLLVLAALVFRPDAGTSGTSSVFAGEAVALALFAIFWVVQTVEMWDDIDPALLSTTRE